MGKKMLIQQLLCNVCLSAPLEWKSYCEMLVLLQLKMLSKLLNVGHVFLFFLFFFFILFIFLNLHTEVCI